MASSSRKVFYIENVEKMTLHELVHFLAAMGDLPWKQIEAVFLHSKLQSSHPLCAAFRLSNKDYTSLMPRSDRLQTRKQKIKLIERKDYKKLHMARWIQLANGSLISVTGAGHWATSVEAEAVADEMDPTSAGEGHFYRWERIKLQGGQEFCYPAFDCGSMMQETSTPRCLHAECTDVGQLMGRCLEAGVQRLVLMGNSINKAQRAKELAATYPDHLRFSVGYHPDVSRAWREEKLPLLKALAKDPGCVAIGECGFDSSVTNVHPDLQYRLLKDQVELACKLRKPLLIHEKGAQGIVLEVLELFRDKLPPVAIQTQTPDCDFSLYIQRGFYIRVSGSLFSHGLEPTPPFYSWLRDAEPWQLDYLLLSSGPQTGDNFPTFVDKVVTVPHKRMMLKICRKSYTDKSLAWYEETNKKWNKPTPLCIPILIELLADAAKLSPGQMSHKCLENAQRFFRVMEKRKPQKPARSRKKMEKKTGWKKQLADFLYGFRLVVVFVLLPLALCLIAKHVVAYFYK